MKTSIFRRAIQALLPATLLLAACGKDDKPAPTPAPDQGRLSVYHMAASANVGLKFLFDDAEKASLNYGQNSLNQALNTGSRTIKVNVASSGANVDTKAVTVEKDKNYSYFAYSTSGTQLAGLVTTDDLTAPAAGRAKIRLVHLGQGATTPLKLSTTASSAIEIVGTETQFATASPFIEILPGSYNVAVTSGPGASSTVVYNVGDGNGTSTNTANDVGTIANKTYEAGKIYTIVYRGLTGATIADPLKLRAVLVQNN